MVSNTCDALSFTPQANDRCKDDLTISVCSQTFIHTLTVCIHTMAITTRPVLLLSYRSTDDGQISNLIPERKSTTTKQKGKENEIRMNVESDKLAQKCTKNE
ncbi:hypothetical protein M404DRAFT_370832 [Pisolithus tinctorius Marx 270]|uniref:Uncharacterized protein n=1 Tax=Pisolithus tinctorius Marx 270 TaxID=870435 RepID=A0A0C3NGB4_PISTI|nr:hypothetical protein M404DRAFT_370832 [Pisolithus tinctorius Marx 270]